MRTLIVTEWTKLRTVRGTWLILAIQQTLVVAGISSLAVAGTDLNTTQGVRGLLSHAGVASAVLSLVLGITAVAGEYRHRTITDTYLTTPTRTPAITAKLATYGTAGLLFGILSAATGLATTAIWTTAKDGTLDLAGARADRVLVGIVAFNLAYAVVGVSIGAMVRNLAGAITGALVWIAIVETTAANLLGGLGRWLPNNAGMALNAMPAPDLLPQWGGAVVLAAYTVVFAGVAMTTAIRRDIT